MFMYKGCFKISGKATKQIEISLKKNGTFMPPNPIFSREPLTCTHFPTSKPGKRGGQTVRRSRDSYLIRDWWNRWCHISHRVAAFLSVPGLSYTVKMFEFSHSKFGEGEQ